MITPTLVSLTLYKNIPFDNKYETHPFVGNFTYDGSNQTSNNTGLISSNIRNFLNMRYTESENVYKYIFPRTTKTGEYNFNHGNLLNTSLVLELSPDEVDSNYMMAIDNNQNYYYFFITNIVQRNGITFDVNLELDVISTYGTNFLKSMENKPVYTERKHAHRFIDTSGTTSQFRCLDVMNSEPITRGLEPKLIGGVINPKLDLKSTDHFTDFFKDCVWGVISKTSSTGTFMKCGDLTMPTGSLIFCANKNLIFVFDYTDPDTGTITHYKLKVDSDYLIKAHETSPQTVSIKYNPYPPFTDISDWDITEYVDENGKKELYIEVPSSHVVLGIGGSAFGMIIKNSNSEPQMMIALFAPPSPSNYGKCAIIEPTIISIDDKDFVGLFKTKLRYDFKSLELFNSNINVPTISSLKSKDYEPKLQCLPYVKYEMKTIYEYDGIDIYNEYFIAKGLYGGITITTYASNYGGDLSLYTTFVPTPRLNQYREIPYYYNKENGYGMYGNPSYTQPVGESPWNQWNASGHTNWMLSKVSSVGGSYVGLMGSLFSSQGLAGVLGNVISLPVNIASIITDRNEIKGKPTSYNNLGTSIVADYSKAIVDTSNTANGFFPYIVKKVVNDTIMESSLDYYYHYGYNTQRNCYFNTELQFTNGLNAMDNNIFTRCTFNYVKLNDNITNKIKDENIPLICKQKLNAIFNNGITLWNMFGCGVWNDNPWSSKYEFYQRYLGDKYENIDYNGEMYDL